MATKPDEPWARRQQQGYDVAAVRWQQKEGSPFVYEITPVNGPKIEKNLFPGRVLFNSYNNSIRQKNETSVIDTYDIVTGQLIGNTIFTIFPVRGKTLLLYIRAKNQAANIKNKWIVNRIYGEIWDYDREDYVDPEPEHPSNPMFSGFESLAARKFNGYLSGLEVSGSVEDAVQTAECCFLVTQNKVTEIAVPSQLSDLSEIYLDSWVMQVTQGGLESSNITDGFPNGANESPEGYGNQIPSLSDVNEYSLGFTDFPPPESYRLNEELIPFGATADSLKPWYDYSVEEYENYYYGEWSYITAPPGTLDIYLTASGWWQRVTAYVQTFIVRAAKITANITQNGELEVRTNAYPVITMGNASLEFVVTPGIFLAFGFPEVNAFYGQSEQEILNEYFKDIPVPKVSLTSTYLNDGNRVRFDIIQGTRYIYNSDQPKKINPKAIFKNELWSYAWDWGNPSYCSQQLLKLGFSKEALQP